MWSTYKTCEYNFKLSQNVQKNVQKESVVCTCYVYHLLINVGKCYTKIQGDMSSHSDDMYSAEHKKTS